MAASDPDGILATPLCTIRRTADDDGVPRIVGLVAELAVVEVVVGLPIALSGREGPAAADVRAYGTALAGAIAPVPVRWSDERMTTVVASRRLAERGVRGKRQRAVVDQAAAVEILQSWLNTQRRRPW